MSTPYAHLLGQWPIMLLEAYAVEQVEQHAIAFCPHEFGTRTPELILAAIKYSTGQDGPIVIASSCILHKDWRTKVEAAGVQATVVPITTGRKNPWMDQGRMPKDLPDEPVAVLIDLRNSWGEKIRTTEAIEQVRQRFSNVGKIVLLLNTSHPEAMQVFVAAVHGSDTKPRSE